MCLLAGAYLRQDIIGNLFLHVVMLVLTRCRSCSRNANHSNSIRFCQHVAVLVQRIDEQFTVGGQLMKTGRLTTQIS